MYDNRDKVIEMVDDGILDPMMALTMCLKWMSNDEVAEMLDANELSERFMEEEEEDDDTEWDWNNPASPHHY